MRSTQLSFRRASWKRPGVVLVTTTLCCLVLIGFVALAVDLGMVAVARTQAQHAADAAAMSGARRLTGNSALNNHVSYVLPVVRTVAKQNRILGNAVTNAQIATQVRAYTFNRSLNQWPNASNFPPPGTNTGTPGQDDYMVTVTDANSGSLPANPGNWSLVRVTVGQFAPNNPASSPFNMNTAFGRALGVNSFPIRATATAVNRPRDVAIVLDVSGSMQFSSQMGVPTDTNTQVGGYSILHRSNNPDPIVPEFGHYSSTAGMLATNANPNPLCATIGYTTTGGERYAACNLTAYTNDGPPVISSFWYRPNPSVADPASLQNAFVRGDGISPAPSSFMTNPAGDIPLRTGFNNSGSGYAQRLADVMNLPRTAATGVSPALTTLTQRSRIPQASLPVGLRAGNGAPSPTSPVSGWEYLGYQDDVSFGANMQTRYLGYTFGPAYYGKTFFIWPPDPRAGRPKDLNVVKQMLHDLGWSNALIDGTPDPVANPTDPDRPNYTNSTIGRDNPVCLIWRRWPVTNPANTTHYPALPPWPNAAALQNHLTSAVGLNPANAEDQRKINTIMAVWNQPVLDWRQRFFIKMRGSAANGPFTDVDDDGDGVPDGVDDNRILFNSVNNSTVFGSSGVGFWMAPGDSRTIGDTGQLPYWNPNTNSIQTAFFTYRINYREILRWIRGTSGLNAFGSGTDLSGPNPFPPNLRSGRLLYYSAIPDPDVVGGWFHTTGLLNRPVNPTWPSNLDELFWKHYIDYVLGVMQPSSGVGYARTRRFAGYGEDYAWGTPSINPKPQYLSSSYGGFVARPTNRVATNGVNLPPSRQLDLNYNVQTTSTVLTTAQQRYRGYYNDNNSDNQYSGGTEAAVGGADYHYYNLPYMDYRDTPRRPKMHMWFGGMSMIDFMNASYIDGATNAAGNRMGITLMWPGTCYEAHCWQMKAGLFAAVNDIKVNHPNDWVSLIHFSSGGSRYNFARVPLGRFYTRTQNALYYPFRMLHLVNPGNDDPNSAFNAYNAAAESRPFNTSFNVQLNTDTNYNSATQTGGGAVPRADGGTSPEMGFKVAMNQLTFRPTSSGGMDPNTSSVTANPEYFGRPGAQKLIILCTDGVANTTGNGTYDPGNSSASPPIGPRYTGVGSGSSLGNGHATVLSQTYGVVDQICRQSNVANPGLNFMGRQPVQVRVIGFGALFEPDVPSSQRPIAIESFRQIENRWRAAAGLGELAVFPDDQLIYSGPGGDFQTRINKVKRNFEVLMQGGVTVSLVE